MKFEVSISPEMLAAIKSEAAKQKVTASHVVREIIGATYGFPVSAPRHQISRFIRKGIQNDFKH